MPKGRLCPEVCPKCVLKSAQEAIAALELKAGGAAGGKFPNHLGGGMLNDGSSPRTKNSF